MSKTLEAYRDLETLLADEKARAIGVSTFMVDHLTHWLEKATSCLRSTPWTPTSAAALNRSTSPSRARQAALRA